MAFILPILLEALIEFVLYFIVVLIFVRFHRQGRAEIHWPEREPEVTHTLVSLW